MKEALDDYIQALYGLLALVNELRWDSERRELRDLPYELGRRFTTTHQNQIAPSTEVTPDCAVQHRPDYGVLTEAKLGLPRQRDFWDEDVRQLQKYDDDLTGWWTSTETIKHHDLVALIPFLRATDFYDHVRHGESTGKWAFQRPLAVVGFQRVTTAQKTWMQIMRMGGAFSDSDVDERLRKPCQINWEILLEKYGDRKFHDHRPQLPIMLQIMWDGLFVEYAAQQIGEDKGSTNEPSIELHVNVEKVTQDLQSFYGFNSSGARSPGIPKSAWVKDALEALVEFRMAARIDSGGYTVNYKRQRGDMLERFGRLCFKRKPRQQPNDKQSTLQFD